MLFRRLRRAYVHGIDFANNEVVDVKSERLIKIFTNPAAGIYGKFLLPLEEYQKQYGKQESGVESDGFVEAFSEGASANYAAMKRSELVKLAAQRGYEDAFRAKKDDLIRWLVEADQNPNRLAEKVPTDIKPTEE